MGKKKKKKKKKKNLIHPKKNNNKKKIKIYTYEGKFIDRYYIKKKSQREISIWRSRKKKIYRGKKSIYIDGIKKGIDVEGINLILDA